ncbi:hypothetical protein ACFPFX_30750 [Streptomyces mauvecolor]|uniref:Uncharacterized protein n=1 Tax=Streptomyces mauvecolor TaxID=58345 RepID=A0ABV9UU06_9ACTN
MADSHNAMVDRLAHLMQPEREFGMNATHRLRTPTPTGTAGEPSR